MIFSINFFSTFLNIVSFAFVCVLLSDHRLHPDPAGAGLLKMVLFELWCFLGFLQVK